MTTTITRIKITSDSRATISYLELDGEIKILIEKNHQE